MDYEKHRDIYYFKVYFIDYIIKVVLVFFLFAPLCLVSPFSPAVTPLVHVHGSCIYHIFLCIMHTHILMLPMYNAHPYFSLKNLSKNVHIIHGKMH